MTRYFSTNVAQVQLTLSVFIGGFALAQLVYGPLSDRFGRRPVLFGGMIIYIIATLACMTARSIEALILGRLLQSLGACAGPVLSRAIVRDIYPPEQSARVMASMASAMALAPAVGPILGGFVHSMFGWQANFLLLASYGAGLLASGWFLLEETNPTPDLHAVRLNRVAQNYGRLLIDRHFMAYTLTQSLVFGGMFSFISGSSFVVIDVLKVPPHYFGLCFAAVVAGYIGGSLIAARISHKLGSAMMIRLGVLVCLSGGVIMLGLAASHVQTVAAVIAPVSLIFAGSGLLLPNCTALAIAPHARMAGTASALLGFIQMGLAACIGGAVGRFYDGTTLPMAAVIAASTLAAAILYEGVVNGRPTS